MISCAGAQRTPVQLARGLFFLSTVAKELRGSCSISLIMPRRRKGKIGIYEMANLISKGTQVLKVIYKMLNIRMLSATDYTLLVL